MHNFRSDKAHFVESEVTIAVTMKNHFVYARHILYLRCMQHAVNRTQVNKLENASDSEH
jgi:hypothetical protein